MRELNEKKNNDCQLDAEQANEYFSSIGKDMNKKIEKVSFSTSLTELTSFNLLFPLEMTEIFEIIKSLNNSTDESVDGINNTILKISSLVLLEYLSVLFYKCYSQGCFPAFFKLAKLFRFISLVTSQRLLITAQSHF